MEKHVLEATRVLVLLAKSFASDCPVCMQAFVIHMTKEKTHGFVPQSHSPRWIYMWHYYIQIKVSCDCGYSRYEFRPEKPKYFDDKPPYEIPL